MTLHSPQRVQLRRSKGWRMPPNTVKVDRTTKWGNPFKVGPGRSREYAVQVFSNMLAGYVALCARPSYGEQVTYRAMVVPINRAAKQSRS